MSDPKPCHFMDISAFDESDLRAILDLAGTMKAETKSGNGPRPLEGKVLAMIFDKPSTRTRVSFDVGMRQLGGSTIVLSPGDTQLGRGETIADTARVLSRYVDMIMIRTTAHDRLAELAAHATVPVINGLTDDTHPCQIMADIMTVEEHRGPIAGKRVAWVGDGNNVTHSFIEAAAQFGFAMAIATPEGREPEAAYVDWARAKGADIRFFDSAEGAAKGADVVVTDTWVSMGQEADAAGHNLFKPYQVNAALMAHANPDALFLHCLPAHRGEEVTDEVMDGPQSVVFDEAENRLHAQKAIMAWCAAQSGKSV